MAHKRMSGPFEQVTKKIKKHNLESTSASLKKYHHLMYQPIGLEEALS